MKTFDFYFLHSEMPRVLVEFIGGESEPLIDRFVNNTRQKHEKTKTITITFTP